MDHAALAREALLRGDARGAVMHAEQATAATPADVALQELLARALLALVERGEAEPALAKICDALPRAYTSLLYLGRQRELRGDTTKAVLDYTRAIKTARACGFWYAEASTAPWLRAPVQHAMKLARDGRNKLFHQWLEGAHRAHGRDEMRRVADGLAMYLGIKPTTYADPRQKPTFLYVPDLPVEPIFDRGALPFADAFEAQTEAIRDELLAVLDADRDVRPFHHAVPAELQGKLTQGGAWDAYFFYSSGARFDAHHDACPRTSAALEALPLDHVREHGPEVCFSILRPGATILPHRGVTNTRAVLHLGLEVPPDCALALTGVREVTWTRGACFAFDDTFEHAAWNRSGRTRAILLGDIWNPHLREPERLAIADLVGRIGDFNRATAARP